MRWWYPLLLLALAACTRSPQVAQTSDPLPTPTPRLEQLAAPVALLKSEPTFEALGWRSRWEWQGAEEVLKSLDVPYEVVTPEQLDRWQGRILVLPNVRNTSPQTVARIKALADSGVKLLGTYMVSYRRADNSPWAPNNFALSKAFGVDFHRWVGAPPQAAALQLEQPLGGGRVWLGRYQAMLVKVHPKSTVLATWEDGQAAIVEGPAGVYVGEDLFCFENSTSPQVLKLISSLLLRLDPTLELNPRPKLAVRAPHPPVVPLPDSQRPVRIGLGVVSSEVVFRAPSGLKVDDKVHPQYRLKPDDPQPHKISAKPYLEVLWTRPNGTYTWSAYRGTLEFVPGDSPQLLNLVDLESYLAGVVPSEVPSYFPDESLKAMAVVARTFALSHLHRHATFDLCSEVHCQVYRGLAKEASSTSRAIAATSGQTLRFGQKPADATFHAVCGGHTADVAKVWPRGTAVAYLAGAPDQSEAGRFDLSKEDDLRLFLGADFSSAYCSSAGRFRWRETYAWPELRKKLEEGLKVNQGADFQGLSVLTSVQVSGRSPSGRVSELVVTGPERSYTVRGDAIRWLFSAGQVGGAGGLNSTLFYLRTTGEGDKRVLEVVGGGWGHGVGMCQEGAAGRARVGQKYTEILGHYYPGTRLEGAAPALIR